MRPSIHPAPLPPQKKNHIIKAGINLGTCNMHEWYLSSEQFFVSNALRNRNQEASIQRYSIITKRDLPYQMDLDLNWSFLEKKRIPYLLFISCCLVAWALIQNMAILQNHAVIWSIISFLMLRSLGVKGSTTTTFEDLPRRWKVEVLGCREVCTNFMVDREFQCWFGYATYTVLLFSVIQNF